MPTVIASAPTATAPVELDLETKLAARLAEMTVRLDEAALAFEVNASHLPAAEPVPVAPILPPEPPAPAEYTTPIAAVLQRALARLRTVGWCAEHYDEQGAVCLVRAIRTEAGGGTLGGEACQFLLDVIRAEFGPWETVPSWNDAQVGPAIPIRILGQAVTQAATRGI
jgi:hypothetical protein